ncbi:sugar kinase [Cellulomonas sp. NPDC089187]|uniref:sugar kinase n=1 Tax=Cellulomonas sp. NPDC089187 TaxID=3154970 RepID=UPI003443F316
MVRLLCAGEVLAEMVAQQVDQDPLAVGQWDGPFPSGAPAIFADQAALCGAEVAVLGRVGDDDFGRVCLNRLRQDGVDVSAITVDPERSTGVAFVRYRSDGSRSFLFHVADAAAGAFTVPDPRAAVAGMDCLHLMGSSAFSAQAVTHLGRLFDAARAAGVRVSVDPNVRVEMLTDPAHRAELRRWTEGAQYVLASEGELEALFDGRDRDACVAELLAGAAELVVIKQGSRGALLHSRDGAVIRVPGISVVEVDATGAGDCFGGTFLSLVLQGYQPAEAVRLANIAGGLSVTARGPMSGNRPLAELVAVHNQQGEDDA